MLDKILAGSAFTLLVLYLIEIGCNTYQSIVILALTALTAYFSALEAEYKRD